MDRYDRQIAVIGKEGQKILEKSTVLVIGVGALGSTATELLCRAGIGTLILQDFDIVQESNLQRQSLFTSDDIGKHKTEAAKVHLERIAPDCSIQLRTEPFTAESSLKNVQLIIDGTDTLEARLLLNDAAKKASVPLIIGAAAGKKGLAYTATEPCWQCITLGKQPIDDCESGVLGMTTHVVASLQSSMAIRALLGSPFDKLVEVDAWEMKTRTIDVKQNPACKACKGDYQATPPKLTFCKSTQRLQVRLPQKIPLEKLPAVKKYGTAVLINLGEGTALVHQHGLIEFEGVDQQTAQEFVEKVT